MCTQDFGSLRNAHHKLLLRVIGFRRKDCTRYKPRSYGEALKRVGSERIETTIRKRQLGSAGAAIQQGDSKLSKRIMFGWLAVKDPNKKIDRRRLEGSVSRKTFRPSGRYRAKAKYGNRLHLELLPRMNGIG